jgi:hypothetical protein
MNINSFLLGVASSVVAAIIILLIKNNFNNIVNLLFFKLYPNISGKYKMDIPEYRNFYENEKVIIILKQFGYRIKGIIETYDGDLLKTQDNIKGKISPSRVLIYSYETADANHHDYGTGIFKISSDTKILIGYISSLCARCENAHSFKTSLKKIE